uniref:Transmembrane protein 144 n=2 Tax=Strongyloides stercoralis TaxID=6248 RepID=A0AAF5D954_STRER
MSKFHWAKQIYCTFVTIVPAASVTIEGLREKNFITDFIMKRSDKEMSPELSALIENEVDYFLTEHKQDSIRNVEIKVSLFDNLLPKTWGSLLLADGVESQFPLIFNIEDYDELREYLKNKFLFLKDTPIPYNIINKCHISNESKKFCIQRELQKSNSGVYLCFPSIAWITSSSIFYGITSFLFPVIGIPVGCLIAALGTMGVYPYLYNSFKQKSEIHFDNVVIDINEIYKKGAQDYFDSCKSIYNLIGKENFGISNVNLMEKRMTNFKYKDMDKKLESKNVRILRNSSIKLFVQSNVMIRCQMLLSSLKRKALNTGKLNSKRKSKPISRTFKEKADDFIQSPNGTKFKILIFTGTIISYPLGALIMNGPLIKSTFPWRFNITYEIPKKLKELIDEEYHNLLKKENRCERDAVVTFSINNDESEHDSIAKSCLSIRFGAQIALPFYVQFDNIEEATEYCKKNLKSMKFLNEILTIDWDSEKGQKIIKSMVLSDNAKRFLVRRDMYANNGYQSFANRPICWATFTAFSSFLTFAIHNKSKLCNKTALSFAILYPVVFGISWFFGNQWHLFSRYMQDLRGDYQSYEINSDYLNGGREYYLKMLERNRLLRTMMKDGLSKISAAGDIRKLLTPIIRRYDLSNEISKEKNDLEETLTDGEW